MGNREINDQNQLMELSDDIIFKLNPLPEGDTISQQQLASWRQTNKCLYSQAAARRLPQTNSYSNNLWIEELTNELEKRKTKSFDYSTWDNDKILQALNNEIAFKKFINHKIQTAIPSINISKAIANKLKYRDTAFFKSFQETKTHNQIIKLNLIPWWI